VEFSSVYAQGFARVAACTIPVALADPAANARTVIDVARECHDEGVAVAVFPELCLSGYSVEDLFLQDTLLDAVEAAVAFIQTLPHGMKISMQLDFERRRRVELEDITGAVIRLGRRLGVPTPVYDVLYPILKVRAQAFGLLG